MKARRSGRLLLVLLPLLLLAGLDLMLSRLGLVPPEPPLLRWSRSHQVAFSPFVRGADGAWVIRPDWIGDGEVHTRPGQREGLRYVLPGFHPVRVALPKPANTARVFVLGGSTVAGLGVPRERAFPAVLGRSVGAALADRPVEVIDLGCPGLASDRVLGLLRVVLDMEPDLVVICTGHNELLSTSPDPLETLGAAGRLRLTALEHSSLFGWLDHLLQRDDARSEDQSIERRSQAWREGLTASEETGQRPLAEVQRGRGRAARRYAANLREMAAAAARANTEVLFVLPPANLRMPPRQPRHADGFTAHAAFTAALDEARTTHARGEHAASLAALDRAEALSPEHAMVPYGRGLNLMALDRAQPAAAALRRARDLDGWTHRITSPLETAFMAAVGQEGAAVDLRSWSAQVAMTPRPPFLDHCHPDAEGHAAIAEKLLAPALRGLAAARPDTAKRGLIGQD